MPKTNNKKDLSSLPNKIYWVANNEDEDMLSPVHLTESEGYSRNVIFTKQHLHKVN